jgi:succinate-semialdehyde dehydrogenase/glutarate-semialdehyde dehydrogenase
VVAASRAGYRVLVLRQPVGVSAAITPWNFPAAMLTRKLGPALAAGCTSVCKPASATPLTAMAICQVLVDAGVPAGVVNLVTTRRARAAADLLMADPRVRKVSFTGSTEVGQYLIRASAAGVKRLSLELGGHAPYLVFADADLDLAVSGLMAAKFRNAGQTCISVNRVYVDRSVAPEFGYRLRAAITSLTVGSGLAPGTQVGPLIDPAAVAKVAEHVEDAVTNGAFLDVGGHPLPELGPTFYTPTLVSGVTPRMLVSREETFGPLVAMSTFDTEDEAIDLANDSPFGLAAYFCTRDYARLLRVAERLDYGIIGANDGAPSSPSAPFGGVKLSGYGREGGAFGIDEYLDVKYVSIGDLFS